MKILIAAGEIDADAADPVALAASVPWPEGSEIRVLRVAAVVQAAVVDVVPTVVDVADLQLTADASARSTADRAAALLRSRGLPAKAVTLEGEPSPAITDYARKWGADLIVVGSRDRSSMERLLAGSISLDVVKHAPCSVLVVKRKAENI